MRRLPSLREAARSFAVLVAVSSLAIAQPLLDVFGRSPETFVFAGADGATIVAFGLLVILLPALLAIGIEIVAGALHPPARRLAHVVLVGSFTAAWIIQLGREVGSAPTVLVVAVSVLAGVGLAIAYLRVPVIRPSLSYLALAPLLFLGLFVLSSPVSDLIITDEARTAGALDTDTPVILLVLDELPLSTLLGPDGRIDAEMFPNFAALAGESTWYRNATTTQALTLRAVPAVLTGQDIGLERLRASGLYDDAVVAVTADHGANFSTGAVYRGPDDTTYEQIMWVPMMIKAPGQTEGVIDDANVTNLDVLPTIAALAGIDVPFAVDGVAADGAGGRDGTKRFYRSHQPPYLPDPEAVLEYDMDEGGQKARDRIYPSVRRGDPSWWPYQVGEHADLIGVPVQSLTVGSPDDRSVTLDAGQAEALAEVDLEDQLRPVFLSGVVDLAVTDDVVVAVNGRVAGVSPVFENFAAETRMAVLVPEMLLGRTNELDLFSIAGDGTGEVVVRPLQT